MLPVPEKCHVQTSHVPSQKHSEFWTPLQQNRLLPLPTVLFSGHSFQLQVPNRKNQAVSSSLLWALLGPGAEPGGQMDADIGDTHHVGSGAAVHAHSDNRHGAGGGAGQELCM